MKPIVNLSRSKRPVFIPDDKDVDRLSKERRKLEEDIAKFEKLNAAHRSPHFQELIVESYLMMRELEKRLAMMDVTADNANLIERAQLKGRWLERFDLTQTLLRDENSQRTTVNRLKRVIDKIASIADMMKGKAT